MKSTETANKRSNKRIYKEIHDAILNGWLASLKMTAGQLAAQRDHRNRSLLSLAASSDCLKQIEGGVTVRQLDECRDDDGVSALMITAKFGYLYQLKGGVTAEDLAAHVTEKFASALYLAAESGHLDQIAGEITLAQLMAAKLPDGTSGLMQAACNGQLELIAGGVTVDDLRATKSKDGKTPLHYAAAKGHLDQIKGGVIFEQLCGPAAANGITPIICAVREGHLDQLKEPVTTEQLAAIRLKDKRSLLDLAEYSGHLLQAKNGKYAGIEGTPTTPEEVEEYASWVCRPAYENFETSSKNEKRMHLRLMARLRSESKMFGRANFLLATTYHKIGLKDEALACAKQAVALMPKDPEPWYCFGHILYGLNRMTAALAALQNSFDLGCRTPKLLMTLALNKLDLDHPVKELESLLKLATELHPDEPMVWEGAAAILETIGKHKESDAAHERFLQLGSV